MFKKITLGIGLIVLVAALVHHFLGLRVSVDGSGMIPRFLSGEPNYDALETDRARQRARPPAAEIRQVPPAAARGSVADVVTDALSTPVGAPAAENTREASPPETVPVLAKDGYWPDFRGPRRDGRYDDGPVLADWPEEGLRRLWTQPIGPGYASFGVGSIAMRYREEQRHTMPSASDEARPAFRQKRRNAFLEILAGVA